MTNEAIAAGATGQEQPRLIDVYFKAVSLARCYWRRICLQAVLGLVFALLSVVPIGLIIGLVAAFSENSVSADAVDGLAMMIPLAVISTFITAYITGHIILSETEVEKPTAKTKRRFAYGGLFWIIVIGTVSGWHESVKATDLSILENVALVLPTSFVEVGLLVVMLLACVRRWHGNGKTASGSPTVWLKGKQLLLFVVVLTVIYAGMELVMEWVISDQDADGAVGSADAPISMEVFEGLGTFALVIASGVLFYLIVAASLAALYLAQPLADGQSKSIANVFE